MIHLVVRRTTDWDNEAEVRAQIPERLRSVVALWNKTFDIPYHAFRSELKHIAQLNLARVVGAVSIPRDQIPAGAIVVPSDDDDWFAPNLATVLETQVEVLCSGYYWPSRFIEVPISLPHRLSLLRRQIFPQTQPKWRCTTNNYAIVMRPEMSTLIDNHIEASRWFVAHPRSVKALNEPLSVMNRTLASITTLRSNPSRRELVWKYERYKKLYDAGVPPDLSWAEPYVEMMNNLMAGLRLRK